MSFRRDSAPRAPGRFIGRYEILGVWVDGHGSPLYVARDLEEEAGSSTLPLFALRRVADEATPRASVESIVAAARASSLIRHPSIVRVRRMIDDESGLYVASDFVPGESLAALLRSVQGDLPRNLAVAIARHIAVALHEVHAARDERGAPMRMLHGDLTPSSVLITHEGELFISDLGLKDASSPVSARDFAYRAPERLFGMSDIDPRADIYALGCLLFEMLTGLRPASDLDDDELKTPSWKPRITSIPALRRHGRVLEAIVLRATAPLRAERHPSALHLAGDLDDDQRIRTPKLDLRSELAKLMSRHFEHRARATRTMTARWAMRAAVPTPRPELEHRPPLAHPLAEPLADASATSDTDDLRASGDLEPVELRMTANALKIVMVAVLLLLLVGFAAIGLEALLGVR
jgi:serine/threonine protein kinase